jgi:hypothetical protein
MVGFLHEMKITHATKGQKLSNALEMWEGVAFS